MHTAAGAVFSSSMGRRFVSVRREAGIHFRRRIKNENVFSLVRSANPVENKDISQKPKGLVDQPSLPPGVPIRDALRLRSDAHTVSEKVRKVETVGNRDWGQGRMKLRRRLSLSTL